MNEYMNIVEEIVNMLSEGECIDIDGYRQYTLPYEGNPNNGIDFRIIAKNYKNKKANEKRQATRAANKEKREIEAAQRANTPVNSLGLKISEANINEVSDELANKVHDKRIDNVRDAKTKEEIVTTNDKLKKNLKLMNDRDHRKEKNREVLQKFKDFYKDKVVTARDTKEAGEEHANAQINQGLRNKLEKIYAMESLSTEDLCVLVEELINETSNWYKTEHKQNVAKRVLSQREKKALDSVKLAMNIINKIHKNVEEGKDIPNSEVRSATAAAKNADIAQSRLNHAQKVAEALEELNQILEENPINFERRKIVKDVRRFMEDGTLNKVRQTPTGNLIGDPDLVKKLTGMRDRLREIDKAEAEGKYGKA